MKKEKVYYYESFTDDFFRSENQDFKLNEDYKWVRNDFFSKFLSFFIYTLALIFSSVYCKLFLHMKVNGRKKLKGIKGGFFIYANHTQPVGDVFFPALCVFPKRIYTVVSTANYGIPVIGKILPFLGALPIVETVSGLKKLLSAIEYRLNRKNPIVIYPEAHVWEYYTKIRPFPDSAFKFPVKFNLPSYSFCVTYKKSKIFKKPIMEVFIDGPFFAEGETAKEKSGNLNSQIFTSMCERSKNSDFEYIKYYQKN